MTMQPDGGYEADPGDPVYIDEVVAVYKGDCLDVLRRMPDDSVDSVVTDPPYGLGFMGKEWDRIGDTGRGSRVRSERAAEMTPTGEGHSTSAGPYLAAGIDSLRSAGRPYQEWCEMWARECLRVLKPGGYMLAFGGTRTAHRLACAIEDAGFELRDSIAWLYGSGFPKSLDVAKAIDKAARGVPQGAADPTSPNHGKYRTTTTEGKRWDGDSGQGYGAGGSRFLAADGTTAPAVSEVVAIASDAEPWQGWGTALKPAHEPIVVARKSPVGTVAANVLTYGTGALNIDACRTAFASAADEAESKDKNRHADFGTEPGGNAVYGDFTMVERKNYDAAGRWPTNVVLDADAAAELDRQSGVTRSRVGAPRSAANGDGWGMTATGAEYDDQGGASRFFPTFRYEAKAPADERPRVGDVAHPTVKPLDLMRWLVRLVTPPDGVVLEPFAGSGTTAEACIVEGFRCIAIEREADYLPLILSRITKPIAPVMFGMEAS